MHVIPLLHLRSKELQGYIVQLPGTAGQQMLGQNQLWRLVNTQYVWVFFNNENHANNKHYHCPHYPMSWKWWEPVLYLYLHFLSMDHTPFTVRHTYVSLLCDNCNKQWVSFTKQNLESCKFWWIRECIFVRFSYEGFMKFLLESPYTLTVMLNLQLPLHFKQHSHTGCISGSYLYCCLPKLWATHDATLTNMTVASYRNPMVLLM